MLSSATLASIASKRDFVIELDLLALVPDRNNLRACECELRYSDKRLFVPCRDHARDLVDRISDHAGPVMRALGRFLHGRAYDYHAPIIQRGFKPLAC